MKYDDLRDFIAQLEKLGELKRVAVEVDPVLEMTEICDRVLRQGGPAILFEKVRGHSMPVLGNLFGTPRRVALGMGQESLAALREVGRTLAYLKEPEPPKGIKDAWEKLPMLKQVLSRRRVRRWCGRARTSTSRVCRSSTAGPATWRRSSPGG